jgi:hypothetical protein
MALPIILYENRFADATPTATDTSTGYSVLSLCDDRAYTIWKAASTGVKYLTVDCGSAKGADAVAMIGHNLQTAGIAVSVESSTDNANWTERVAPGVPDLDRAFLGVFDRVSARYWRVKLANGTVAPQIGELWLGCRMTFPKAMDQPYTPYTETVKSETAIGKTGSVLGSVLRYKPLAISCRWTNLPRTFVHGDFQAFWREHASKHRPFWWVADIGTFPQHCFFVTITDRASYATPMSIVTYVKTLSLDMTGVQETVEEAPAEPVYIAYTGGIPHMGAYYDGQQAVAEDAMSVTVTDSRLVGSTYVPNIVPSWNTAVFLSSTITGQFTVVFNTAAPAGATLYWSVVI